MMICTRAVQVKTTTVGPIESHFAFDEVLKEITSAF